MTPLQFTISELTKELIAYRSYEGMNSELDKILDIVLQKIPLGFNIERFERNGIKSALVYLGSLRPEKFRVLLNCHLDIIPAKEYQYTPSIDEDKLMGAGANDMKGNVAAALFAFLETAKNLDYPLALQLVTDEEIGGFNGTRFQVESGVRADFIIATEPTNLDIVTKAKGVLCFKIHATGKTAHGAYPWRGTNAIEVVFEYIKTLQKIVVNPQEESWVSTMNISGISTDNTAFNKIPDTCTLSVDIRFTPGDDTRILEAINESLPENCTLEIIEHEPSVSVEEDNPILLSLIKSIERSRGSIPRLYSANGTSDARHFSLLGGKGVEFGSVGGGIGQDDEWVSISGLELYYQILVDFLKSQNSLKK